MNTINATNEFSEWLKSLKDLKGRARILVRIQNAERGNFGDCKMLDAGVSEMRIDFGPGYRVYFAREGRTVYLLLSGGDKSRAHSINRHLMHFHQKGRWQGVRRVS